MWGGKHKWMHDGADNKKRLSVFTWLKEKEYNIYCLQETHSTILDEVLWKKDWGGGV